MKSVRIIIKTLFFTFLIACIGLFSMIFYLGSLVNSEYKIKKGDELNIGTSVPMTVEYNGTKLSNALSNDSIGDTFDVDLKMFGVIPFSTVNVEVVDEMYVAVLGNPFGMKLYTEGVLVIDMTEVDSENGNVNPAKEAGIKKGDYIVSANGTMIYTNEDLAAIVESSGGEKIDFVVQRGNKKRKFSFSAVKSKETGDYRIGLWIRDSTAGIGTLTFYSPATGIVCGLGHGICDDETGTLFSLNSGQMVSSQIISVAKGSTGSLGELKGRFTYDTIADISLNCENGVYGKLKGKIDVSNLTEIALKQEVKDGEAQILCTINGEKPKLYSCTVKKRSSAYLSDTQNLTVTVTDEELIKATGGIVQGMSGSPIVQNGKLIGAVTHVLIDDPTTGYGIFAENMLKEAQYAAEEEDKLKDAS